MGDFGWKFLSPARNKHPMSSLVKWIGGATALVLLFFGSAALTGWYMQQPHEPTGMAASQIVEGPIEIDPAAMAAEQENPTGNAGSTEAGADATAQGEKPDTQADAAPAQPAANNDDGQFVVKRILPIDGPIKYGEWHWNTDGVPADGKIIMTVDLKARVISVFKGGYEIGAAAVLLGTDEHPTPLGTFPITRKQRHNVSEKYNNAPMPYSMFLTSDGVALHGSDVENGYASHGCIGMPDQFAAKVFAIAKKGDRVIITDGETLDMGESIL